MAILLFKWLQKLYSQVNSDKKDMQSICKGLPKNCGPQRGNGELAIEYQGVNQADMK